MGCPDYAALDGLFEQTAESKLEAVGSVTASLDRLTADLAALGGVSLLSPGAPAPAPCATGAPQAPAPANP